MMFVPSFLKICQMVQKLLGGHRYADMMKIK
jgi:hypothetical protein